VPRQRARHRGNNLRGACGSPSWLLLSSMEWSAGRRRRPVRPRGVPARGRRRAPARAASVDRSLGQQRQVLTEQLRRRSRVRPRGRGDRGRPIVGRGASPAGRGDRLADRGSCRLLTSLPRIGWRGVPHSTAEAHGVHRGRAAWWRQSGRWACAQQPGAADLGRRPAVLGGGGRGAVSRHAGRGGSSSDEAGLPIAVVTGTWITITLILFGMMGAALAVGLTTALGWAVWHNWPSPGPLPPCGSAGPAGHGWSPDRGTGYNGASDRGEL
jgi:hypothetical protein